MAGYIGRDPRSEAIQSRVKYTATAGQTSFLFAYQPGFLDVYLNGIKIEDTTDYVATTGTEVVLTSAATEGQVLELVGLITFSLVNGKINYSATGAPTTGDDSADGYRVGSMWIDTTNDEVYRCTDDTAGAAVWIGTTLEVTDLGPLATVTPTGTGSATTFLAGDNSWKTVNTDPTMGGDLSGTASNAQLKANVVTDTELNSAKVNGIEDGADVTDAANVSSAGALMKTGGTLTGNLSLGDSIKAQFGAGNDLEIYHSGTTNYIKGAGTYGNIDIQTHSLRILDNGSNVVADFSESANSARLYYAASGVKLATTSTGIDVTGNITAYDSNQSANPRISVGRSSGEAISLSVEDTTGTINYKQDETGTQDHQLKFNVESGSTGANGFKFSLNNAEKLSIDSTGITTTGNISVTGTVAATAYTGDGSALTGIDALPTQTGHTGKYLTTDGVSTASWATLDTDANSTTKGLYEMAHTISTNYSIASGNNAMTAGPITLNTGASVTIPTGSTWVIA